MSVLTRVSTLLAVLLLAFAVVANCKKKKTDDAAVSGGSGLSEDDSAKAKKLYEGTCQACHGPQGKGDGPAGMALNPKARNFADTASYKQGATAEAIAMTLEKGVDGGKTGMVGGLIPSADDRMLVAKYIVANFQK